MTDKELDEIYRLCDEIANLKAKLAIATEALEYYDKTRSIELFQSDGKPVIGILYPHHMKATEALQKIKGDGA